MGPCILQRTNLAVNFKYIYIIVNLTYIQNKFLAKTFTYRVYSVNLIQNFHLS